jgi:hypothetical protein
MPGRRVGPESLDKIKMYEYNDSPGQIGIFTMKVAESERQRNVDLSF